MPQKYEHRDANEGGIRLQKVFQLLYSQKKLVIATLLIVALPFVLAAFLLSPVYRADVLLSPVTSDSGGAGIEGLASQLGGIGSLVGIDFSGKEHERTNVAILRSRALAERMILEESLVKYLYSDYWDSNENEWSGKYNSDPPSIRKAYELFDEDVRSVIENRKDGLFTVRIEWTDRFLAAAWANLYVKRANEWIRAKAIQDANNILEFLNSELEKTSSVEVRQAMFRLIEIQLETLSFANARTEYAFKVIDKAVVMDDDMHVWPNRVLLILVGVLVGFLLSVILVVFRSSKLRFDI